MARKRSRVYSEGDRIQVSLNQNLSPEFLEWINKQSDLTNFFLYSAQELYKQTGNIDVIDVMPRKIDIANVDVEKQQQTVNVVSEEPQQINKNITRNDSTAPDHDENHENWHGVSDSKFEDDNFS